MPPIPTLPIPTPPMPPIPTLADAPLARATIGDARTIGGMR